jgi:hypothetical protein
VVSTFEARSKVQTPPLGDPKSDWVKRRPNTCITNFQGRRQIKCEETLHFHQAARKESESVIPVGRTEIGTLVLRYDVR